jgi:peptidoglycan hydrolase-like protein with peptidoglycan-binding domain
MADRCSAVRRASRESAGFASALAAACLRPSEPELGARPLRCRLLTAAAGLALATAALPAAAGPDRDGLEGRPPSPVPVEVTRTLRTPGLGGAGEAYLIDLLVEGVPYVLHLDEAAGISTIAGGDEPEIGKRMPEVRPVRTSRTGGGLALELLVDGATTRVVLPEPQAGVEPAHGTASVPGSAEPAPPLPPRRDWVARLQRDLAALGFDPGPADGRVGQRTETALARFGRAFGYVPTAEIGAADAEAVRQAVLIARAKLVAAEASHAQTGAGPIPPPAPAGQEPRRAAPASDGPRPEGPPATAPRASSAAVPSRIGGAELADAERAAGTEGDNAGTAAPPDAAPVSHVEPAATKPAERAPGPEERAVAPRGFDLAAYLVEPFEARARRTVQALAERPEATPAILTGMVGSLLARNRLDEAGALAADLERRHGATPELTLLHDAIRALGDGKVAADTPLLTAPAPTGPLWRAIAGLRRGETEGALALVGQADALAMLPEALRRPVAMAALERLVESRRFAAAHEMMRRIEGSTDGLEAGNEIAYWRARELELKGDGAAAATVYATLVGRPDRLGLEARYRLAGLRLRTADAAAATGIARELQLLAAQWLEPELAPGHDELLIEALLRAGRVAEAFEHLEHNLAMLERDGRGDGGRATALRARGQAIVDRLIDGSLEIAQPMRLTLLALAERWAVDDAAGRRRLARAAQALAEAGLSERARAMLDRLAERGSPTERAEAELARAAVALAAGDPVEARGILEGLAPAVADIPPLRQRRLVLMAEALTAAGDPVAALRLLEAEAGGPGDGAFEAARLAAARAAGDWPSLAARLAADLPADPAAALAHGPDPALVDDLLGLAAALRNGGQEAELARLASRWGPLLEGRPEAPLFAALVEPEPRTRDELVALSRDLARLGRSTAPPEGGGS